MAFSGGEQDSKLNSHTIFDVFSKLPTELSLLLMQENNLEEEHFTGSY